MKTLSSTQILIGVIATLLLAVLSMTGIALLGGGTNPGGAGNPGATRCTAPSLAGTVVNVTTTDRGRSMMAGPGMMRGSMRLTADRGTVVHGKLTFLVTNAGTIPHEMLVVPLAGTQSAGTRPVGRDGRADEAGSLGEASNTCAEGEGILPSANGRVTLDLPPGRYELFCNLPGHYWAGMYAELTVT